MMETFLVLGLCFILYEALDFFQGCINSASTSTTDQIDAYRRQLDEQRQQQQQEQFLANLTPLLAAKIAAHTASSTPTASTASVISDLHSSQQSSILQEHHQQRQQDYNESYSASTPALHASNAGFRPANHNIYEINDLYATSSLPRDYYYVQQQKLINKTSSKSLISKFSSSSDNRIFPESTPVLGLQKSGVITTQPGLTANTFDCQPPVIAPSSLALDLKRAILCNNNNNNNEEIHSILQSNSVSQANGTSLKLPPIHCDSDSEESVAATTETSSPASESESAASISLTSGVTYSNEHNSAIQESDFNTVGTCSTTHADFREIECERLRRKCVSIKRIYSISEKF